MVRFSEASIEALIDPKGYDCACGRHHQMKMDYIKIGSGAINAIPEALAAMGTKRPFVVCDVNTKDIVISILCYRYCIIQVLSVFTIDGYHDNITKIHATCHICF